MQLHDLAVAVEQRRDALDLPEQALQVALALAEVAGNDPVAAAVETGVRAEGHVHVQ